MKLNSIVLKSAVLSVIGVGMAGCSTNAGNGALIGGAAGAGAGAILSHGHPGGVIVGGALGALTGAIIGSDVDRAQARDRYYYNGAYYYNAPPPPPPGVTETTTTYRNPDGSTTTYINRYTY